MSTKKGKKGYNRRRDNLESKRIEALQESGGETFNTIITKYKNLVGDVEVIFD